MISVIIPTLNAEGCLEELLVSLSRQRCQPDELIIGDSSSTDRTIEVARKYSARIVNIVREDFDHGSTRTMLAQQACGDILVYFTQDAVLADRDSLEKLITPLRQDPTVACSYGRQLPNRNATPFAAHLRLFNYPPESLVRSYSDRTLWGLKTVFISNTFAAYSRKALSKVGYFSNGLIFGEDTCTLGRMLQQGHRVAYVGDAAVFHSHNYSLTEEFHRSFDIGVLHSSKRWLLETYGTAEGVGAQYVRSMLAYLWQSGHYFSMLDGCLRVGAKYAGYKLGRQYTQLPAQLCRVLSMNRRWWSRSAQIEPASPVDTK